MRIFLTIAGVLAGAAGLGMAAYLVGIHLTGNFAVVLPGELYRSGQPTPAKIVQYEQSYGIKTIINLRGSEENATWYKDEMAVSRKLGLTHIDFPMRSDKELSAREAHDLVAILRGAPRPILIHCRSGADRTGLASVIYLTLVAKVNEDTAERQLSILYGHVGVPYLSPTYAMDATWEEIEIDQNVPG